MFILTWILLLLRCRPSCTVLPCLTSSLWQKLLRLPWQQKIHDNCLTEDCHCSHFPFLPCWRLPAPKQGGEQPYCLPRIIATLLAEFLAIISTSLQKFRAWRENSLFEYFMCGHLALGWFRMFFFSSFRAKVTNSTVYALAFSFSSKNERNMKLLSFNLLYFSTVSLFNFDHDGYETREKYPSSSLEDASLLSTMMWTLDGKSVPSCLSLPRFNRSTGSTELPRCNRNIHESSMIWIPMIWRVQKNWIRRMKLLSYLHFSRTVYLFLPPIFPKRFYCPSLPSHYRFEDEQPMENNQQRFNFKFNTYSSYFRGNKPKSNG